MTDKQLWDALNTGSVEAVAAAFTDSIEHGIGFMKDGKHTPIADVYLKPIDEAKERAEFEVWFDVRDCRATAWQAWLERARRG